MFCSKCGAQVSSQDNVCRYCGASLQPQQSQQQNYQYNEPNGNYAPNNYNGAPNQYAPRFQQPQYPMKWYKFLIYFALFAGGIVNLFTGIQCFTGGQYQFNGNNISDTVYSMIDGLESIDKFYGIALIIIAVLQIVTRFHLSGYKKSAPAMVTAMYAISTICSIIYIVGVSAVTSGLGADLELSSYTTSIVVSVAMCVANSVYFNKRKSLFIN